MKRVFGLVVACVLGGLTSGGAPALRYDNYDALTFPPQIDAVTVVNHSTILIQTEAPFETQNTLYFTNRGTMFGQVGFQFDLSNDAGRRPSASFNNRGDIRAEELFGGTGLVELDLVSGLTVGSYLKIYATNVVNTGIMGVGPMGHMVIQGSDVNLSRGGLVAGTALGATSGSDFTTVFGTSYVNPNGITENYWGVGINATMDPQAAGIPLNLGAVSAPDSGLHEVVRTSGFTNFTRLPQPFNRRGYSGFAFTNMVSPTNLTVQVVFVPTNRPPDTTLEVRFAEPDHARPVAGMKTALVALSIRDVDAVSGLPITNRIFIIDRHGATTNAILMTNLFITNYARPDTIDFALDEPPLWAGGVPTNAVFTPQLIFPAASLGPEVTNYYAAVSVNVGSLNRLVAGFSSLTTIGLFSGLSGFLNDTADTLFGGGSSGYLYDVTNNPARIDIVADTLDMYQTRLKADGPLTLKAKHFTGRAPARVDAPYFRFDIASTNGLLTVSNVVPSTVKRLQGELPVWSTFCTNLIAVVGPDPADPTLQVTNTVEIRTHVLIVETGGLSSDFEVETLDASFTADRVEYFDVARITRSLRMDCLEFRNANDLIMISPRTITASELPRLEVLQNEGRIVVPDGIKLGVEGAKRGRLIDNKGAIGAASVQFSATEISNSGLLIAGDEIAVRQITNNVVITNSLVMGPAVGGVVELEFDKFKLEGGSIAARADVVFRGKDMKARDSAVQAGASGVDSRTGLPRWFWGSLVFDVTDSLNDAGVGSANRWTTYDGVRMATKPALGDLRGTELRSVANRFGESVFQWAAEDRGATEGGYLNNVALQRLVLEGNFQCVFTFAPAGAKNALYVDELVFSGYGTNSLAEFQGIMNVQSGFTIYYRTANVSAAWLRQAGKGRVVAMAAAPGTEAALAGISSSERMPLRFESGRVANPGGSSLVWSDMPGGRFVVQSTDNPASGTWTTLGEARNGMSRVGELALPDGALSGPKSQFFRVIREP